VEPRLQRNGAGSALMAAVEDWLRPRGVWKLNLLVRRETDGVVRFYEKLGYGDQNCVALGWMAEKIGLRTIETLFLVRFTVVSDRCHGSFRAPWGHRSVPLRSPAYPHAGPWCLFLHNIRACFLRRHVPATLPSCAET